MCALKVSCDNPCRCVTDWCEGSKLHRGTFQMRWLLFTTKRALDLSSVVNGHTSWHTTSLQKKWPEVKRFPQGPRVYSQPDEVTGTPAKHSHTWEHWPHGPNWDLCVCADACQPRRRRLSGVSALLSDLLTTFFLFVLFEACHHPLCHCHR